MERHTKYYTGAIICGILAILTSATIIGGIVFAILAIGFLAKGARIKHDERPWWTKSFLQLYRERKE